MGLLDFGGRVVMRYVADTSEAKASLKSLSAEEKKLAEERIKAQEAANKATKKNAENWQFAAGAIGAATAAIAIGKAAVQEYAKTSADAAARVNELGDKFQSAMDRAMAGIGSAVMAFEPLLSVIAEAGNKLVDLGEKGKWVASKLSWITGIGAGAQALNWIAGGNQLGGAAGALQPKGPNTWSGDTTDYSNVAQLMASLGVKVWNDIAKEASEKARLGLQQYNELHGNFGDFDPMMIGQERAASAAAYKSRFEAARALSDKQTKEVTDALLARLEDEQAAIERAAALAAGSAALTTTFDPNGLGKFAAGGSANQKSAVDALMAQQQNRLKDPNGIASEYAQYRGNKEQTFLESHFGPLQDFDAYAAAFTTLSGATTAALDAWIDGSESAGKAFKHFVGDALKALANQMAVEALKHGAYALGSLAFGDFGGAARHAAASAAFGAGAAVAAVAAKEIGTSASAKNAASASAPSSSAPQVGGNSQQPRQAIIVYGDSFANDSPRARTRQAKQLVDEATGNNAWSYS